MAVHDRTRLIGRLSTFFSRVAMVDEAAAVVGDGDHGAGPRSVGFATDERGGQPALQVDANPGGRQVRVGRDMLVGKRVPDRLQVVAAKIDPPLQCGDQATGLRPGCVQAAVGDAVHAGRQHVPLARMVAQVPATSRATGRRAAWRSRRGHW